MNNRDILFYITDLLGIYFYGPKDYLQLYGRITLHVPQMKNIADNHFNLQYPPFFIYKKANSKKMNVKVCQINERKGKFETLERYFIQK